MSTFLGIGAGPIQTSIFVSGASRGGFSRIVLADVDQALVDAVRRSGTITVNTAGPQSVRTDTYDGIEIYNPLHKNELAVLTEIASGAATLCTALPSTSFYRNVAPWLTEAFAASPDVRRYVYTAENSTTAAQQLETIVGEFPETHYLDTVIGKMSNVFSTDDCDLPPLAPGLKRGHLVEAFSDIYTSSAPGIDKVGIKGIYPKPDLVPFEEAKLYGHNAVHFVVALLLRERGAVTMDEASRYPDLLKIAQASLIDECGEALCRKHTGADPFFDVHVYAAYAQDLIARMTSPVLKDAVERVARDLERKLGWNDRLAGAIRLCLEQDVRPKHLLLAAELAARRCFGADRNAVSRGLSGLWRDAPQEEAKPLVTAITRLVPDLPGKNGVDTQVGQ